MSIHQLDSHITGEISGPLLGRAAVGHLLWILAAALLGFGVGAIFAGLLHLPRDLYLIPYVGLVSLFLYAYVRWSGLSISNLLRHNWLWGLLGAILLGMWTVNNILSQPASPRSEGLYLIFEILWVGVVYGLIDALLLSALPVLATKQAFSVLGWYAHWWGKILAGLVGLLLSLVVTIIYHLGYPECRLEGGLFGPVLGNGAMTLGYLLTNNPLAAVISHMAMHIAGVLHGPASVLQLPPHY